MTDRGRSRFEGKVALVTGGNSGIGLETAKAFAAEGARVMIAARRVPEGEQAVAEIKAAGGEAAFVETDITSGASVRAMVEACIAAYGRLDVAFNNSGITGPAGTSIIDTDEAVFDQVMGVNAKGVWLSMKHQIPEMLKVGGGAIVNCGSFASLRASPRPSVYFGSKHAVYGLTKSAALEYADQNIRVNLVCPGLVMTDLIANAFADAPELLAARVNNIPMKRAGRPREVSDAVLWLASDESSFVTGIALPVDGATAV
jgi:NAD(P)-dependent dehydrogenase (short-subunit alcohol dehydrogenase family)